MDEHKKLISIVTPCYDEEANVEECYQTVKRLFAEQLPDYDYEHVFCDNASCDSTVSILKKLAGQDPRVKIIVNARNFGPYNSVFNGVLSTQGDAVVVLLAADLQDPPELIPQFVHKWESGYEIVYGIRKTRQEGILLRSIRKAYYHLVARVANINLVPNVGEFQLVDRKVIDALKKFDDYYPYIRGMIAYCGFRSTGIEHVWKARRRGISKHTLFMLLDQGLNGLVSFTKVPLRLCMGFGLLIATASLLYSVVTFFIGLAFRGELVPPGIPTLIVAVFFFSGLQLFFFGLLGEYIAAIHFQVRKRPLVIERERVNFEKE